MRVNISWIVLFSGLGLFCFLFSALPVSAATTKPTSFCVTKATKTLHQKTVTQMSADIKKAGAGHEEAVKKYKTDIEMIWAAMEEPYCGYGKYGASSARKSYVKSIARTRETFLKAAKLVEKKIVRRD